MVCEKKSFEMADPKGPCVCVHSFVCVVSDVTQAGELPDAQGQGQEIH